MKRATDGGKGQNKTEIEREGRVKKHVSKR